MTPSKYFLARVAQAFGIHRKNKRMSDAAGEMHLLREAETHLGLEVWEKLANVEELSVEYWNLRKLAKEHAVLQEKLQESEARLAEAHEERSTLLNVRSEPQQELAERRAAAIAELEAIARRRDQVVARAREVRRSYDGLKMKLEVLSKEPDGNDSEITTSKSRLEELKAAFTGLKDERATIATETEQAEARLAQLDLDLNDQKKQQREQASGAFQVIGEANREISAQRAELGLLETRMRQLYAEIGRHMSRLPAGHPTAQEALKQQRGLVEIMHALRRSIAMNHRLAGQS